MTRFMKMTEYGILQNMIQRCRNPNATGYERYGARGISVYPEWDSKGGFVKFLEYIGPRPSPLHSVDRYPNKNGNYEPGNVRWATSKEQAGNRNMPLKENVRLSRQSLRVLNFFLKDTKTARSGSDISLTIKIASGSLYPILVRFEDAGWMKSEWEKIDPSKEGRPRKRLYLLTPMGRQRAKAALAEFQR